MTENNSVTIKPKSMNITTTKPAEKPRVETITARHVFTAEERDELARNLARSTQDAIAMEAEKKQVAADYKAKQESIEAKTTELAIQISNGYVMRPTDCFVKLDPKAGRKQYLKRVVNKDEKTGIAVVTAGEVVKEEAMEPMDFERGLPLYETNYLFKTLPDEPVVVCTNPLRIEIAGVVILVASTQGKWLYTFGDRMRLIGDEYDALSKALKEAISEDQWGKEDSKILDTQGDEIIAAILKDKDSLLPDAVITVTLREKK